MTAASRPQIDRDAALARVTELMAIPGKSCEEGEVADRIVKRLQDAGVDPQFISFDQANRQSPAGGQVGNLIVKLPGTIRGPRRLLMGHIDTVPLCVGCQPVRRGDVIRSNDPATALGADNRAGASVLLTAALEIHRQKLPHPPVTFFWPVQEEIGLYGARLVTLSKLGQPKLCFNWDGGFANYVTIGATGDYAMTVDLFGLASHAGVRPERGISAAAIAGLAIADLVQNGWHGLVIKGKKTGTSNIGVVQAGSPPATNVVLNHLRLLAEARSHDPVFRKKIVDEFRKAFERAVKAVRNDSGERGRVEFTAELKYESFRLDEKSSVVTAAKEAVAAAGLQPEIRISNGGLDANWLTARGLPTVTLGCGQQDVHTVNESLHIENFLHACQVGLFLATGIGAGRKD